MLQGLQSVLPIEEAPSWWAGSGGHGSGSFTGAPERAKLMKVSASRAEEAKFEFVDLFAGIGGFHMALSDLDGRCVFASEIDAAAARIYADNWGLEPAGDIVPLTAERMEVPPHDVLAAGFPCQPFSKSGFQRGMDETRGTLFWNIARVLEERRPAVILLENVRNLAGPRHRETWRTIIRTLRELGYKVSSVPTIFSPHNLPPERGGRPQVRERVFITGTYVGRERAVRESEDVPVVLNAPVALEDGSRWDPQSWDLNDYLDDDSTVPNIGRYQLSAEEVEWVDVWEDFILAVRPRLGGKLPGFPIWADAFQVDPDIDDETPAWKADFLRKNSKLYAENRAVIDAWFDRNGRLEHLPPSRRKLEWQAQDAPSLWETIMHFRPSGIRAKKPTYVPALVAITQTTIVGARRRRITPREAARLQGLEDTFTFGEQGDALSYKQLGNGVNVGAAQHVLREHVRAHVEDVEEARPGLAAAILGARGEVAAAMRAGA